MLGHKGTRTDITIGGMRSAGDPGLLLNGSVP